MQKTAQKRSILNKLREMTNISGQAAEKFFNPEFQKVMESLREKDNDIRSLIAGEAVDNGDPGSDPVSLKSLLKSARSNFNRREYMTSIAELARFHKKVADVNQKIENLKFDVDQVHHEFLFKDLGDEYKQQLHDLKQRFAEQHKAYLVKEASIMDFLHNITSKRGRALALWEKRYPQQIKKLKTDTANLLNKGDVMLSLTLSSLKDMASARATRDVDRYVKAADKISKGFNNYDKYFRDYYAANVKGFLEKIELVAPTQEVKNDIGNQNVNMNAPEATTTSTPSQQQVPSSEQYAPTILAPMPAPATPSVGTVPPSTEQTPPPVMTEPPPSTEKEPVTEVEQEEPQNVVEVEDEFPSDALARKMWGNKTNAQFIAKLEALANEDPVLLKKEIFKYATSLQKNNLSLSLKLFKFYKSIK